MDLPSQPRSDRAARRHDQSTPARWVTPIVIGLIAAAFVVMMILHLSGAVGPGAH